MRHGAPGGSPSWARVSHRNVDALRSEGIKTFESCDGGDGHAYTEPTVRFAGENQTETLPSSAS